ncbi:MAG: helix-turn-helix transcriptional regulator [Clostridia bacterium]|nr:helix-turn-helix transcriptional regulator [Clostridia bacterium]
MIRLNDVELLKQHGHTKYWLYKQLGMSYQNFNKMINNQTASIRYENIEAMCQLLECTPNELFRFEEDVASEQQE